MLWLGWVTSAPSNGATLGMSRPAVGQRRAGALILWQEAALVILCLLGLVFRANSKTYYGEVRVQTQPDANRRGIASRHQPITIM